ncbi:alpha/beta fold hydrolase [Tsukamurella pulmonis]|uniref:alpha/beta fold hydrolase n=1 Tax=Tsukamurella pulmonis TaxID=47312 RepID=UPI000E0978A9|nr:alpha/beta fold hydrolase [Tsukamurella pulmonis]RDH13661.1 alpha/beta fold hydrolase [Tsukamurella pulmonis]
MRALTGTERSATLPSGVELCYREDGDPDGRPLLLIAGLGLDMLIWSDAMVAALAAEGFRVIRFDNRDAGRTSSSTAKPPGVVGIALGRPRGVTYDLGDMAADTIGLLDHLDVTKAHVVGMSMGGMIAQTLAARYPARVASLTSIFSTTGNPRVGAPSFKSMALLARPHSKDPVAASHRLLTLSRHIASAGFPFDEGAVRSRITASAQRAESVGADPWARVRRQMGAIKVSGDRTTELRRVLAPTLVIHGDRDVMVNPTGGAATRDAIPGATMRTIHGMGHDFPSEAVPLLVDLISEHAKRAESAAEGREKHEEVGEHETRRG